MHKEEGVPLICARAGCSHNMLRARSQIYKRAFKSSVQRIWCFLLQSYRTPTCSFIHVFNTGLNNMSTAHHSSEGKKPTDQLLKLTLKEVSRRDINKVS